MAALQIFPFGHLKKKEKGRSKQKGRKKQKILPFFFRRNLVRMLRNFDECFRRYKCLYYMYILRLGEIDHRIELAVIPRKLFKLNEIMPCWGLTIRESTQVDFVVILPNFDTDLS